ADAAAEAAVTGSACVAPATGWIRVGWSVGGLRNVCRPEAGWAAVGWPPVGWLPMGWRPPGWWLGPEPTRAVVRSAGRMTGRECWGCCGAPQAGGAPQPGAASGDGD